MDTDQLINQLAHNLEPTVALPSTPRISLLWYVMVLSITAGAGYIVGPRPDYPIWMTTWPIVGETVSFLMAAILSSCVAFDLRFPQVPARKINTLFMAVVGLIWFGWLAHYLSGSGVQAIGQEWRLEWAHIFNVCVVEFLVIVTLLIGVLVYLVRRGASTQGAMAGLAVFMAAASFAALAMRYLCPSDDYAHLFLWHFMPVLLIAAGGALAGRGLLVRKF